MSSGDTVLGFSFSPPSSTCMVSLGPAGYYVQDRLQRNVGFIGTGDVARIIAAGLPRRATSCQTTFHRPLENKLRPELDRPWVVGLKNLAKERI